MVEQSEIRNPEFEMDGKSVLKAPFSEDDVLSLNVGDIVLLGGEVVTGRDRIHKLLFNERPSKEDIPFTLEGSVLYHCGPVIIKMDDTYRLIAAGPTTSMRLEMYEHAIIKEYGIRAVMGKGGMGEKTLKALSESGCVYLSTFGGAGVYLADRIKRVAGGWKVEEFGIPEAMWLLEVENFPAIVTMDAHGKSLHKEIEEISSRNFKKLLAFSYSQDHS